MVIITKSNFKFGDCLVLKATKICDNNDYLNHITNSLPGKFRVVWRRRVVPVSKTIDTESDKSSKVGSITNGKLVTVETINGRVILQETVEFNIFL